MLKNSAEHCVSIDLSNKAEAQALTKVCCEPIIRQGADFWRMDGYPGRSGQAILYEDDSRTRAYQQDRYGKAYFTLLDDGQSIHRCATAVGRIAFGKTRQVRLRLAFPSTPAKVNCNAGKRLLPV